MSKLIRITSREPTAIFDAAFNAQLELPADAKIAMQSVAITASPQKIIIDSANHRISYQVKQAVGVNPAVTRTFTIPTGIYTLTNLQFFFNVLSVAFNNSVTFLGTAGSNKMIGLEWNTGRDTKGCTKIEYKLGNIASFNTSFVATGTEQGGFGTPQRQSWRAVATANVTDESRNAILPFIMSRGFGQTFCRVGTLKFNTSAEDTGFIWGVTTNLQVQGDALSIADIYLGVHVTATADHADATAKEYKLIKEGVVTGITTPFNAYIEQSTNNEYINIRKNGPELQAVIHKAGGETILGSITLGEGTDPGSQLNTFHTVMAFRGGKDTAMLNGNRTTVSPFNPQPTEFQFEQIDGVEAPPMPPNTVFTDAENQLVFESDSLAKFLGYKSNRIPRNIGDGFLGPRPPTNAIIFSAEDKLAIPNENDAYLVLLDNVDLESFDSFNPGTFFDRGGQRRNILAVIPQSNSTGNIVFEPPYPTFIRVGNPEPILLRNIRARVLNADYSEVATSGLGSIVLLVE